MDSYYQKNKKLSSISFSKDKRLLKGQEFQCVFNETTFKIHQSHLLFFVKLQPQTFSCRLGLAITKKKIKRANERNRVKRLIRENFRLNQQIFTKNIDIVVIVKQNTSMLSNHDIHQQCLNAFSQINEKLAKRVLIENKE